MSAASTGRKRTVDANRHLGFALASVAGGINAGGFLAVRQYTSHMTGIVSSMADDLALGNTELVLNGIGGLLSFVAGAASSAVMVNYARRREMHSEYAFPLLLEAVLLLCFGLLGAQLSAIEGLFVPLTVMLLCFIMGLQNAVISKLSNAEIRTTHMTGVITDIGIELGKLGYWNGARGTGQPDVVANRERLKVLLALVGCFLRGWGGRRTRVQAPRLRVDGVARAGAGGAGQRAGFRRPARLAAAPHAPMTASAAARSVRWRTDQGSTRAYGHANRQQGITMLFNRRGA